jgi:hypothetical protein
MQQRNHTRKAVEKYRSERKEEKSTQTKEEDIY